MIIRYLQKTTLIDYPGKIACTLFLQGCNLRCGYCHNPELIHTDSTHSSLSEGEVLSFLKKRQGQLEGVCITGGEPLLSLSLDFLQKIKQLGYLIKIDTNGTCPDALKECIDQNLVDYIAMDIKACPEAYIRVVGVPIDIARIEQSIAAVMKSAVAYEFRTTVITKIHTPECMNELIQWIRALSQKPIRCFILQGFQMRGKVLDKEYQHVADTDEAYLNELKQLLKPFVNEIRYRY